ncbi:hypothetical protein NKH77_00150 [Streptomyces sp. M19]
MTRKKAPQKRAEAKAEYNAFLAGCPTRQLLDRIPDKWVVLILCARDGGNSAGRPGAAHADRPTRGLRGWAQGHMAEVLANRETYDSRTS